MCAVKSPLSKPSPVYSNDLLSLHRLCLISFIEAFKNLTPKLVFILDYCPQEYSDLIEELVPFEYEIHRTASGINETCLYQYRLFEKSDEDVVLFQEYDYLWLPDTGKELMSAVEELDFATPYDHPDKYEIEKEPYVKVVGKRHWKKTQSTTATFATTRDKFMEFKDIFYKHGYLDHERWLEVGRNEGELYSPIPGLATHMVEGFLSPHIDWKASY